MAADGTTHIVIAGGGFGGVYTAIELERSLSRAEINRVRISIVSQENYLVFQPLLPEVVSGSINVLHAISPIRRMCRRSQLYTREIEDIDLHKRTVRLSPGYQPKPIVLEYDHLVIALGNRRDDSKVAGAGDHATPFKTLADALRLRNQLVHALEQADIETDPVERKRLLTFVVAGGGFSGVECVAEINDFLHSAIRAYRSIQAEELRVILVQSAERILPEMQPKLAMYAHRILERRGVEIRLNERLQAVTSTQVFVLSKATNQVETIATHTVVSTVPAGPHAILASLPCEQDKGRLRVSSFLEISNWPGVWALGDCAAVPQRDGMVSPPTAQHALRQAKTCARNILASIRGQEKKAFNYSGMGSLGSVGRRAAVAEVMGFALWGFPAWILWRAVYLWKMPGLDRKVRVMADWLHDIFFPKDITQIRIYEPDDVHTEHFEPGEVVFEQGDYGDKVYAIVQGTAEVIKEGLPCNTLGPHEVFGEIALMSNCPRTATIRAKTALDVVAVRRDAFEQLVVNFPGVGPAIDALLEKRRASGIGNADCPIPSPTVNAPIAPVNS